MTTSTTRSVRTAGALAAACGLVLLTTGTASAHVTVTPSSTQAGSYSVLSFGVPHACNGSPTTRVSIQVPTELSTVTPTVHPGWTVEKVTEPLDPPVDDGHGGLRTERVAEVVYTATTPLPEGYRDVLSLQVKLPDTLGETLYFPAVQTCEVGETGWVQVAQDGQDPDALESPAPAVPITGGEDDAPAGDAEVGAVAAGPTGTAVASDGDGGVDVVSWVALAFGAGGLAAGGAALARSRSRG